MKRTLAVLLALLALPALARAQASGNVGYSQGGGKGRAEAEERARRAVSKDEAPPTATSVFVEASVLMNVKADEHVAVFGVAVECATVAECNQKMDATVNGFRSAISSLGVGAQDVFVDFSAQNKIYGFKVAGTLAKEELVGFELKKTVAVHYRDKNLLDKLVVAASRSNIFDLVKVDYIVRDTAAVQDKLMEEAARVVKHKAARQERLLGVRLSAPPQVYAERPGIHYPTELYDSYTAFESEEISDDYYRQKYTVQRARKGRTFFFNPLGADGFDSVINPVVIEPLLQFTLYLKVKYEIEQPKK